MSGHLDEEHSPQPNLPTREARKIQRTAQVCLSVGSAPFLTGNHRENTISKLLLGGWVVLWEGCPQKFGPL